MMNVLALSLVLTTLVTAGVFSPSHEQKHNSKEDVIVKEGHRVVVVEYEKDYGNTKKAHEAADKVYEVEEEAKETIGKLKDRVTHKSHEAKEYVKDSVFEKAREVKEGVTEKAKRGVDNVIETAKSFQEEVETNASKIEAATKERVSDGAKKAGEIVENASEKVKDSAHRVKDEGKKGLKQILLRVRGIFAYVYDITAPGIGVLHLLGLATAYGMCMWVTFVSSYVLAGALPRQQFGMVQSKIYPVYFKAMAYSVGLSLLGLVLSQPRKRLSSMRREIFQGFNLLAPLLMILVNFLYLEPRSSKGFASEPTSRVVDSFTDQAAKGTEKEGFVTKPGRRIGDSTEARKEGLVTEPGSRTVDSVTDQATIGTKGGTSNGQDAAARERTEEEAVKAQMFTLSEMLKRLNSYSSLLNVLTLMSLTWHLVNLGQRLNSACKHPTSNFGSFH
ncbi:Late embryogenesis abundant protein (LEA) family protein [Forsythia ovata]|uniref:Late embryogenesis abundant protein (LEA) family protein n=1 Tax=Forsythia ovata TaxID=205694 RepID=A0ABD1VNK9_9LAMI